MLTDLQWWLRIALITIVGSIAAFDLVLLYRYGPEGTLSVALREWSESFPLLPYLIAFGMGAFLYHIVDL